MECDALIVGVVRNRRVVDECPPLSVEGLHSSQEFIETRYFVVGGKHGVDVVRVRRDEAASDRVGRFSGRLGLGELEIELDPVNGEGLSSQQVGFSYTLR